MLQKNRSELTTWLLDLESRRLKAVVKVVEVTDQDGWRTRLAHHTKVYAAQASQPLLKNPWADPAYTPPLKRSQVDKLTNEDLRARLAILEKRLDELTRAPSGSTTTAKPPVIRKKRGVDHEAAQS
jgi:hypothetical protein